jgi:putative transposase
MKTKSGTVISHHQDESGLRHLPLVDLLVDTKTELLELALRSGLKVFTTMLEEDRKVICGPRYAHEPDRPASRAGTVRSEVVLGGRKVAIRRPRARTAEGEVPLPTFQAMAKTDPLDRRVVEQMLVGVATRQYARSLEPLDATMESRGTSKSTVSRRFVARTRAQLETWQARALDDLPLAVLLLDGVHVGDHCLIVALGITERKQVAAHERLSA